MTPEAQLLILGITLPDPNMLGGNYVSAKTVGQVVYLSGVISTEDGRVLTGTASSDADIEPGYHAARCCALSHLAVLRHHLGSLNCIAEVISVNGYVNAAPGFVDPPKIINGYSDLLVQVFGEAGRHVRAAVGVSALPRNCLVECQMTVRLHAQTGL
jgi:enamine deaminase RidA (YjgF/YER057c/UK114 family)